jgi:hypothetical protein
VLNEMLKGGSLLEPTVAHAEAMHPFASVTSTQYSPGKTSERFDVLAL